MHRLKRLGLAGRARHVDAGAPHLHGDGDLEGRSAGDGEDQLHGRWRTVSHDLIAGGGASYTRGQIVDAVYHCRDGASGPGLSSCTGTVPAATVINTSTPGQHSFTVTAVSKDGQRTTATVSYTVVLPDNRLAISDLHTRPNGRVTFRVAFPGPGTADVMETAWLDDFAHAAILLQPAPRRFVFARMHLHVARAGRSRSPSHPTSAASG